MDSANNSSSHQSSSGGGGGGDDVDFDSQTFAFANTNNNSHSISNNNLSISSSSSNNNNNLPFFDSLSFLDPTSSFPLLSPTTQTPPKRTPTPTPTPRNPKKRSRASRRAPTTVLTTDTSNFRAMVQEFTGIPAPPFSSSSSSYPRPRFDFFNPAIKFQFPNINASQATNRSTTTTITSPQTFNYQLPPPSSSNLVPGLNFGSLLQSQLNPNPLMTAAAAADYGVADGGLPGFIGPGWGQDAGCDPTRLRQSRCKLDYSASGSATEFNAEKVSEARGEGMVESWICSSD